MVRKKQGVRWTALLLPAWVLGAFGPWPVRAQEAPHVAAPSAILVDAGSGRVLYEKNADDPRPPASMTKLMTLLLMVQAVRQHRVHWQDRVPVSEAAYRMGGAQIWLEPGEELPLRQLALAIAVGSANDACLAVAEHLAGSEASFASLMNREARRLGMTRSHFVNSHGLDAPGHVVTARDMAKLAREAVRYPELLDLTSRREDRSLRDGKGGTLWLVNPNRLLAFYPGADGLKTGYTSRSGYCLTATAKREGLRLIAVVMGEPTARQRNEDAAALLNYGFAHYRGEPVAVAGQNFGTVWVRRGRPSRVPAVSAETLVVAVPRQEGARLERRVSLTAAVDAPLRPGQRVGEVVAVQGGRALGRVPLVAAQGAERVSLLGLLWDTVRGVAARAGHPSNPASRAPAHASPGLRAG